jgi:hypothetical protein
MSSQHVSVKRPALASTPDSIQSYLDEPETTELVSKVRKVRTQAQPIALTQKTSPPPSPSQTPLPHQPKDYSPKPPPHRP